jgi:hypothetical protein
MKTLNYKPKHSVSSNTNNFIYRNKTPNEKNVYNCGCKSCNELKYNDQNKPHSMELKRTQSKDNLNYIFYGSNQKQMSFRDFFKFLSGHKDDDVDEDNDENDEEYDDENDGIPSSPKKGNYRKPISLRLPI